MTFRVGQEVVCVEGYPGGDFWPKHVKGDVYTIASLEPATMSNEANLTLVETGSQLWWRSRFRPIVKTDISLLEEIARKVTQGKRVDA